MATSLLVLLDDIATVLDDVALLTKVAAKKTAGVALLMTVGVYGLVAGIVKIDDLGLYLSQRKTSLAEALQQKLGRGLLLAAPLLMKSLSVLGTLAMFLVGGGILAHGWHDVGQGIEQLSAVAGSLLQPGLGLLLNMLLGALAGGAAFLVVSLGQRLRR